MAHAKDRRLLFINSFSVCSQVNNTKNAMEWIQGLLKPSLLGALNIISWYGRKTEQFSKLSIFWENPDKNRENKP